MDLSGSSSSKECDIYFVIPNGSKKENVSEYLQAAFKAIVNNNLESKWITSENCLKFSEKQPHVFICDPFEGNAFQHLVKMNCRVLGPLCVLMCLQQNQSLPVRNEPVYSLTMRKIVASSSNLSKSVKTELAKKVQAMGGKFSLDLTASVTHLITNVVGSQKYHVANNFKLPIMLPEWVEDCWQDGQYRLIHASEPIFDRYRCPILQGLVISVSQVECEERAKIQQLVTCNGGTYSGALKAKETTHLLLVEATGNKYKYAVKWNVHCVHTDWLYESLKVGYALNEKLFEIKQTNSKQFQETSTPISSTPHPQTGFPDFSMISNASVVSKLEETTCSNGTVLLENNENETVNATRKDNKFLDNLNAFDVSSALSNSNYLDGCCLFLYGFNKSQFEKLKKIINASGGMWCLKYTHQVTHIVVADVVPDYIKQMTDRGVSKPFIVNVQWLLDSFKQSAQIGESAYDMGGQNREETTVLNMSELASPSTSKKDRCMRLSVCDHSFSSYREAADNVASQYAAEGNKSVQMDVIDVDRDSTLSASREGNTKLVPRVNQCSKPSTPEAVSRADFTSLHTNNQDEKNAVLKNITVPDSCASKVVSEENSKTQDSVSVEGGLFANIKFAILGFGPEDTSLLIEMVTSNGGMVEPEVPDLAVVPILEFTSTVKAEKIVTNCWICMCLENEKLLPFDANPLFTPIKMPNDAKPLKHCVISFSQYAGSERDCLMRLAEKLGATCQEYFNRKFSKTKGLLANTHLVLPAPEGVKYEAAKKWGIPTVTKHWIIEIARRGEFLPEDNYNVESHLDVDGTKNVSVLPRLVRVNKDDNPEEHLCIRNKRIETLISEKGNGNPSRSYEELTPNRLRDPNYHPNFHVESILEMLQTPECSKKSKRDSTPLQELLKKHLTLALQRFGNVEKLDQTEMTGPLHGVVICVSKHLADRQLELNSIATNLGGSYSCKLDASCTHFIHQGKYSDLNRELKTAKEICKHIVSPEWLYACQQAEAKLEESVYPSTYNPKMSLGDISATRIDLDSSFQTPKKATGGSNSIQTCSPELNNVGLESEKVVQENPIYEPEVNTKVCEELDQLLNATSGAKNIKKRKKSASNNGSSMLKSKKNRMADLEPKMNPPKNDYVAQAESQAPESSQNLPITWDDPMGRLERERIAEQLAHIETTGTLDTQAFGELYNRPCASKANVTIYNCVDVSETCDNLHTEFSGVEERADGKTDVEVVGDCLDLNEKTNEETEKIDKNVQEETRPKKVFMLSGFVQAQKENYIKIVADLGGEIVDSKYVDARVTHLVLCTPLKSEKFLCCLASGKWILHKSYLEDSQKWGHFLEEEDYEWGGPRSDAWMKSLQPKAKAVGMIPHRWRYELSSSGRPGAFDEWVAVVFAADSTKRETYIRILKSGGARIESADDPVGKLREVVTHAFIDTPVVLSEEEMEMLLEANVNCVRPEYLAYFLTDSPSPSPEKYEVQIAVKLKEKLIRGGKRKTRDETLGSSKKK